MKGDARVVEVVAHNPAWSERFTAAQRLLVGALPTAVSIEHIGSTSIPGLAAKPIVDIQVVVPEVGAILADLRSLEQLGYVYRPLVFADDDEHLFFVKDTAGKRTEHLHVFGVGGAGGEPALPRLHRGERRRRAPLRGGEEACGRAASRQPGTVRRREGGGDAATDGRSPTLGQLSRVAVGRELRPDGRRHRPHCHRGGPARPGGGGAGSRN